MAQLIQDLSAALGEMVEKGEGSVVRVDGGRRRSASGTVVSQDGLIVTALHALEREEGIEVFDGSAAVQAKLVGTEPGLDLALLRAEKPVGKPAQFAPESELRRGHLTLSLSRPGRSVRAALGVVSALAGEWRASRGSRVEHYVELSLPLEAGYSGSLILDAAGRAAGVGMGGILRSTPLVLTKAPLERLIPALVAHGRVRRAYLGVSLQPVRLPSALSEKASQPSGLIVVGLEPNGAAEHAGIGLGDVLLSAGGARLSSLDDLFAALGEDSIDKPLKLELLRAGAAAAVEVTPKARS